MDLTDHFSSSCTLAVLKCPEERALASLRHTKVYLLVLMHHYKLYNQNVRSEALYHKWSQMSNLLKKSKLMGELRLLQGKREQGAVMASVFQQLQTSISKQITYVNYHFMAEKFEMCVYALHFNDIGYLMNWIKWTQYYLTQVEKVLIPQISKNL